MDLALLPIGAIIVYAGAAIVQPGWIDITDSFECMEQVNYFQQQHPTAGEFLAHDKLFCIKKISEDAGS